MKVYTASKLKHAPLFRELRTAWKNHGIDLHARWLDQIEHEDTATSGDFRIFWMMDEQDVRNSDAVLVYGEKEDELRGALVETGIAIGTGIPIFIAGDSPSFGTWINHPHVIKAGTLQRAKTMILRLSSISSELLSEKYRETVNHTTTRTR